MDLVQGPFNQKPATAAAPRRSSTRRADSLGPWAEWSGGSRRRPAASAVEAIHGGVAHDGDVQGGWLIVVSKRMKERKGEKKKKKKQGGGFCVNGSTLVFPLRGRPKEKEEKKDTVMFRAIQTSVVFCLASVLACQYLGDNYPRCILRPSVCPMGSARRW